MVAASVMDGQSLGYVTNSKLLAHVKKQTLVAKSEDPVPYIEVRHPHPTLVTIPAASSQTKVSSVFPGVTAKHFKMIVVVLACGIHLRVLQSKVYGRVVTETKRGTKTNPAV